VNPQPGHRSARDVSLRLLEIINNREFDKLGEVFADDVVTRWPQTGERVRGLANARKIYESYPGGSDTPVREISFVGGDEDSYLLTPMFTMVRAEGEGATATSTVRTRYPDGTDWYVVTIAKTREGKIVEATQFFAPVLEAPEWRAPWVEYVEDE
jgi:ketosteroid isomerase-like protein